MGTYSITENNIITVTPDLPCSMNGATLMIYSITAYQANPVPLWVSVGSSTGSLTISTPNVTADTVFKFYIDSTYNGASSSIHKQIQVIVLD